MKKLWRLIALVIVGTALPACSGATFSCARRSDGTIECGVETHGDGNHEKPVLKKE